MTLDNFLDAVTIVCVFSLVIWLYFVFNDDYK